MEIWTLAVSLWILGLPHWYFVASNSRELPPNLAGIRTNSHGATLSKLNLLAIACAR